MIDARRQVLDGHIGDSWVSVMLRAREPRLLSHLHTVHCLFGLHLIGCDTLPDRAKPVAIVGSERSAVILSELFPDYLWMAYAYQANLTERLLVPLEGREVTLIPRAAPVGDCFLACLEIADQAKHRFGLNVSVSTLLEDHASQEQKERGIDLVDFLYDR